MASKAKAGTSTRANENAEFFDALRLLEKEKGISGGDLIERIRAAIVLAVRHDYGGKDNIHVVMNPDTDEFRVSMTKTVVDEVTDPDLELLPEQAAKYKKNPLVGDTVEIPFETKQFGRIAAQSAKSVIRQGIREAEKGRQLEEFQRRNQELVTALVSRIDPKSGAVTVEIGHSEAMLPKSEQIGDEEIHEGDHIKVFVVDVKETEKGPRMYISRTHAGLVKRLFEMEVPEIFNGAIEVKAIAREAGSRTKMAVVAHEPNVDAVGSCIGPHGTRVAKVVEELGGEKIDIVEYSDDPAAFITAALLPAKALSVEIDPDGEGAKACRVTVPESQLSLAIGNKGQNARLAAKLTGWKIDIRPESGFFGE